MSPKVPEPSISSKATVIIICQTKIWKQKTFFLFSKVFMHIGNICCIKTRNNICNTNSSFTYLGYLWWHDTTTNNPTCIMSPKVPKPSISSTATVTFMGIIGRLCVTKYLPIKTFFSFPKVFMHIGKICRTKTHNNICNTNSSFIYLGYLWWHDTTTNNPTCIMSPNVPEPSISSTATVTFMGIIARFCVTKICQYNFFFFFPKVFMHIGKNLYHKGSRWCLQQQQYLYLLNLP